MTNLYLGYFTCYPYLITKYILKKGHPGLFCYLGTRYKVTDAAPVCMGHLGHIGLV